MSNCFYRLSILLVLMLALSRTAYASELQDSRGKLEEIERRLNQTSRSLEAKQSAESQLLSDLRAVRQQLTGIQERALALEQELAEIDRKKKEKEEQAVHARHEVEALQGKVHERLVALYKFGDAGPLRVLFSSTTPAQIAEQFRYLNRVVRHDRTLLGEFRQRLESLDTALHSLETLSLSRQDVFAKVQRTRKALETADALKRRLLSQVRTDQAALAAVVADLKERKERLRELVKKLESPPGAGYSGTSDQFSVQKGRLPWPSQGRVLVRFGKQRNPELGTLFSSNGIEVEAGVNGPISAVSAGRVVFAAPFKGYGNLVIVDHGDSYHTLYGHASRLNAQVGKAVKSGDVLAYAGYPGTDGVYFEIRHHGVPLDPLDWVSSRSR